MALQPCRSALAGSTRALRTRATSATAVSSCSARSYSTPSTAEHNQGAVRQQQQQQQQRAPRWSKTPEGMKAAVPMDFAKDKKNKIWAVNDDPVKLDEMYTRLLGPRGDRVLPEELKWLAVTHKSFDQGRRGFNDRLAMMGRATLMMEATKSIVSQSPRNAQEPRPAGERKPFKNEQLQSVDNLSYMSPKSLLDKEKMFALAQEVGLLDCIRWKPRQTDNIYKSGGEVVANSAMYAIVGAITLQHGSVIASEFARNKILLRLQRL